MDFFIRLNHIGESGQLNCILVACRSLIRHKRKQFLYAFERILILLS